jgi:hypothetical protein
MKRMDGFLFRYPGMSSLVVVYHDSNDFYYSGHIGTCFIITMEYRACGWRKMHYFTFFIMLNQWFMMTCVRTHYFIDMVSGMIFAHYIHMISEKLAYYADIGLLKIGVTNEELASSGAGRKRHRKYYKPCHKCGWSNVYAGDFMSEGEKKWLKHCYSQSQLASAVPPNGKTTHDENIPSCLVAENPCDFMRTGKKCLYGCDRCSASTASSVHSSSNL